jgi:hypothetical protein
MEPQDIIKSVAELDRWAFHSHLIVNANCDANRLTGNKHEFAMMADFKYLTSLDAIVPLREKLVNTQALKDKWMEISTLVMLETEKDVDEYALTHLTAAQESKTLLLLFDKWY